MNDLWKKILFGGIVVGSLAATGGLLYNSFNKPEKPNSKQEKPSLNDILSQYNQTKQDAEVYLKNLDIDDLINKVDKTMSESICASEDNPNMYSDREVGEYAFFKLLKEDIELAKQEEIVRKAVSIHYGKDFYGEEFAYKDSMTLDEVNKLAEGVDVELVKNPEELLLYRVEVGFGGGNFSSFYFPVGSQEPLGFTIVDNSEVFKLKKKDDGSYYSH